MYTLKLKKKRNIARQKNTRKNYIIVVQKNRKLRTLGSINYSNSIFTLDINNYLFALSSGLKITENFKKILTKKTSNFTTSKNITLRFIND